MSRRLLPALAALVVVLAAWRNRASLDTLLPGMALCGAAGGLGAFAYGLARPLRARGFTGRIAAGGILIIAMLLPLLVLIVLGVDIRRG